MEIAIMIEGQNGLNWNRWQRLVKAVEELGFHGLYRSDHYTNANPPDKDSLELWVSLAWLASNTNRIEFGPLVSPVSFRDPTMTARMASAVDDLSGNRLILGLGAGWQVREHAHYGWDLLGVGDRFDRFEEGLKVITRLLQNGEPANFSGNYYRLNEAVLLPRPSRPGGPPILIGGNGPKRTLPLVARFASEWNGVYLTADQFSELNEQLDGLLRQTNRQTEEVRRSLMTGIIFARDWAGVERQLKDEDSWWYDQTPEELRQEGLIVGTSDEIGERLQHYSAAGVQRIMLQWLDLDDLEGLEALAGSVLTNT
jgi:F420-dependent oxidoreductase-like protein